jgi:DNA adenine methylase
VKLYIPPIKCQGIKSKLVNWIKNVVADIEFERWIEPFCGSGVVAFNIQPEKAVLCDTNPHLINFYNSIKKKTITDEVVEYFLKIEGDKLRTQGEEYYYEVRKRFNEKQNPLDFLFLNRSCFNGMIRFNKKGEFNVPFCRKPERFSKAYVTKIKNQVSYIQNFVKMTEVDFLCQSYEKTIAEANYKDIIYCDPPYIDRHTDYFNGWNTQDEYNLFKYLSKLEAKFILSTWHSNIYRKNKFIEEIWNNFHILTRSHFYFLGGKENNRNSMTEALVINFKSNFKEQHVTKKPVQMNLFDSF